MLARKEGWSGGGHKSNKQEGRERKFPDNSDMSILFIVLAPAAGLYLTHSKYSINIW